MKYKIKIVPAFNERRAKWGVQVSQTVNSITLHSVIVHFKKWRHATKVLRNLERRPRLAMALIEISHREALGWRELYDKELHAK